MNKSSLTLLLVAAMTVAAPLPALAQSSSSPPTSDDLRAYGSGEDGVGVAPSRFELPMLPGTEKTVVVNVYYNSASGESRPFRLVAYLGDWSILSNGTVEYYKAGSQPRSASPWMIYSPSEVTARPGKVHPIRVTISAPKDAMPGDHLAALFVESRPDNLKLDENRRRVILRFRMAALFYIMIPRLTNHGSLQNLTAEATYKGVVIKPTLKNEGNSHLRPTHSVKITDRGGGVAAQYTERESLPVLSGSEMSQAIEIDKLLPPGVYTVYYRVDFKDGKAIQEGQTTIIVKDPLGRGFLIDGDAKTEKSGSRR
ncbi:MAG TPA: hypothetical protein VJH03_07040 [Blastocatellia bacterium]|nr:hypothetical protein [Blastocatellia bacterium]